MSWTIFQSVIRTVSGQQRLEFEPRPPGTRAEIHDPLRPGLLHRNPQPNHHRSIRIRQMRHELEVVGARVSKDPWAPVLVVDLNQVDAGHGQLPAGPAPFTISAK